MSKNLRCVLHSKTIKHLLNKKSKLPIKIKKPWSMNLTIKLTKCKGNLPLIRLRNNNSKSPMKTIRKIRCKLMIKIKIWMKIRIKMRMNKMLNKLNNT